MNKYEIIENYIKSRCVGYIKNILLRHLETCQKEQIKEDKLNDLYKDYLSTFEKKEDDRIKLYDKFIE